MLKKPKSMTMGRDIYKSSLADTKGLEMRRRVGTAVYSLTSSIGAESTNAQRVLKGTNGHREN